jgi:hypothetical protein
VADEWGLGFERDLLGSNVFGEFVPAFLKRGSPDEGFARRKRFVGEEGLPDRLGAQRKVEEQPDSENDNLETGGEHQKRLPNFVWFIQASPLGRW